MNYKNILNELEYELGQFSFECHPFKIKWYNSQVDPIYKLNAYHDDTFAVLIINTPLMFEKLFLPYLFKNYKSNVKKLNDLNDPIDDCCSKIFNDVKDKLDYLFNKNSVEIEIDLIKDFEMIQRRAKILMQTVCHISGAAYLYDKNLIHEKYNEQGEKSDEPKKNFMGVCLHPEYGGWFAMRCVFIFKNLLVQDPILKQKMPNDVLNGNKESIINLLEKFNFNWKDWSYRDVIPVAEKYSDIQKEYFQTDPKLRKDLLKKWLKFSNQKALCLSYNDEKIILNDNNDYLIRNFYII